MVVRRNAALKIEQHDGANALRFRRSFGSAESDKRVVTPKSSERRFGIGIVAYHTARPSRAGVARNRFCSSQLSPLSATLPRSVMRFRSRSVESPEIDGDDEPSLLIAELNDVKGDEGQKNDRQEHQRRDHASCAFRPRTETQSPEARQEFR